MAQTLVTPADLFGIGVSTPTDTPRALSETLCKLFWLLGQVSTWHRYTAGQAAQGAEAAELPAPVGSEWPLAHAYDKGVHAALNSDARLDIALQDICRILGRILSWSNSHVAVVAAPGEPDDEQNLVLALAPAALDQRIATAVEAAIAALPNHTEPDAEALKAMVAKIVADMPPPVATLPDDLSTTISRMVAGLPKQFAVMPPDFRQIVAEAVALLPRPTIHLPADFTDRVGRIVDTKLADIRKDLTTLKSHTHALFVERKTLEDKPFNRAVFWWSLLPCLVVGWIIAGFSQTDWGTGGRAFLAALIAGVLSGTFGLVFGKTVKTSVVTGVFVDGLPLAAEEAHNG